MSEPTPEPNISELLSELLKAYEVHRAAERRTAEARNDQCTALNRVNSLQRQIDAAMGNLRKISPRDADWMQAERKRHEVPVS